MLGDCKPMIEANLIAYSVSGGAETCDELVKPTLLNNVLWDNEPGVGYGHCGVDWWQKDGNVSADPLFCDTIIPGGFSGRVAKDSPALTHPDGPIGAFDDIGCSRPLKKQTTWGLLKATSLSKPGTVDTD